MAMEHNQKAEIAGDQGTVYLRHVGSALLSLALVAGADLFSLAFVVPTLGDVGAIVLISGINIHLVVSGDASVVRLAGHLDDRTDSCWFACGSVGVWKLMR